MGSVNTTYKTEIPGLRYRILDNGNKSYFIEKMVNGARISKTFGEIPFQKAKDRFYKFMGNLKLSKSKELCVSDIQVHHLLSSYLEEHFQYTKNPKKSYSLLKTLRDKMGDLYYIDLNKAIIEKYKYERSKDLGKNTKRPISPRTIQAEVGLLSASINHAVDMQRIPSNTVSRFCNVKLNEPDKVVFDNGKAWGADWTKVYNQLGDTTFTQNKQNQYALQMLFLTLYETGMRPNEILHFEWNWLKRYSQDRYYIYIPANIVKISRARKIPVSAILLKSLNDYKSKCSNKHNLVFPSPVTNNVRYEGTINKPFNTAIKNSGILQIFRYTPYALRRTRISIWDTIDEGACECAVGHTPKSVHRKHYSHFSDDRLFKLVGL